MIQLVRAPARRAGDPDSNPGPGENFSLKVRSGMAPTVGFLGAERVLQRLCGVRGRDDATETG